MTVSTGYSPETTGMRAVGTMGHGIWLSLRMCRSICYAFRYAITAHRPPIFAVGAVTRRHVGANTGVQVGNKTAADGIAGIAALRHLQHPYRITSADIQATAIRVNQKGSIRLDPSVITTDHARMSPDSILSGEVEGHKTATGDEGHDNPCNTSLKNGRHAAVFLFPLPPVEIYSAEYFC